MVKEKPDTQQQEPEQETVEQDEPVAAPEEEKVQAKQCEEKSTDESTQPSLEQQLAEVQEKAAEYLEGWQRCQATFANFRKRSEAEQTTLRKAANAALLTRLLPVIDDFERAIQALPPDIQGHTWLEGILLIQRKIKAILETEGAEALELKPGDEFDPKFHQAVLHQETQDFEDGQVVAVIETGYALGERILRPALVVVAKAPAPPPAAETENVVDAEATEAEIMEEGEQQGEDTATEQA